MVRWKRFGVIVVKYLTDHDPQHVHVFQDGVRDLKFDIENWTVMEGEMTPKAREASWSHSGKRGCSMRNPKFKQITPNYRKRVLEVVLREGRRLNRYNLPFAVFTGIKIGSDNRFASITIEADLAEQGATFVLEDGTREDFPADFVLYYSDPAYQWSPINQLKRALRSKISDSKLSIVCWPMPLILHRPKSGVSCRRIGLQSSSCSFLKSPKSRDMILKLSSGKELPPKQWA